MKTYSPPQVAKLLKVNADTIRAWIRSGRLPASNYPGTRRPRYRISERDLEQFHESNRVTLPEAAVQRRQPDVHPYY